MAVYLEKDDTAMAYSVLAWALKSIDNNTLKPGSTATIADWIQSQGGWVSDNLSKSYFAITDFVKLPDVCIKAVNRHC